MRSDEGPNRLRYEIGGVPFELVVVPPCTFRMGSPDNEEGRETDETQHVLTLTRAYAIATTPVTQALYQAVMGVNPSKFRDGPDAPRRPVEMVSWFDAARFCNALSEHAKLRPAYVIGAGEEPSVTLVSGADGFRLPTEAEWECAARSGGDAYVYAGSDDVRAVAWFFDAVYDADDVRIHPPTCTAAQPVAARAPTRWGLYEMSGNVWEWCQDWSDRYATTGVIDPDGAADGFNRIHRGGSWYHDAHSARVAGRGRNDPGSRYSCIGLRVVRTVP